jgi:hypothetical protein
VAASRVNDLVGDIMNEAGDVAPCIYNHGLEIERLVEAGKNGR